MIPNKRNQERRELQTFGEYRLLNLLGRGGMGQVFLAEHLQDRVIRALKLISRMDGGMGHLFLREFDILKSISHPNIVDIYEYGVSDGVAFFPMDFIRGKNLLKHI